MTVTVRFPMLRAAYEGAVAPLSTNYASGDGAGSTGNDNTPMNIKSIVISAGALRQRGDRLRARVCWAGTTGGAITGRLFIGGGAGVTICTAADAGGTAMQVSEAWCHYVDNQHANILSLPNGVIDAAVSLPNVANFQWDTAQTLYFSQSQVVDNHIIVYSMTVDVFPLGTLV